MVKGEDFSTFLSESKGGRPGRRICGNGNRGEGVKGIGSAGIFYPVFANKKEVRYGL